MRKHIRADERRVALRDYVADLARQAPPVFVGRQRVVNAIEEAADSTLRNWRNGKRFPGLTCVVQGAPGAGKSSLLAHLAQRWEATRATGDNSAPLAVNVSLLDLRNPRRFREEVDRSVPASLGKRYVPIVAGALVKLVMPGSRLSEEAEKGVRELTEKRNLTRPVVLMVDEAQNARPHEHESAILAHLHEGHLDELPVLPVLAGLRHLREHLGREGIRLTRYADDLKSVHTLGSISDDEVYELFQGWLERFRVAADGEYTRWADALVRDSHGWPMHTNHFLTSLAGQLLKLEQHPCRLSSADLNTVRRAAAERRVVYYSTRYDHPFLLQNKNKRAVGQSLATLRLSEPAEHDSVLDAIREAFEGRIEAEVAFEVLRERGFLQRTGDPLLPPSIAESLGGVYACPIPSLASYAAAQESRAHLVAILGDTDALKGLLSRDPSAVDMRDAMDRTPLHVAAECRWADAASMLLDAGADPDAEATGWATPRAVWPEYEWPDPQPIT